MHSFGLKWKNMRPLLTVTFCVKSSCKFWFSNTLRPYFSFPVLSPSMTSRLLKNPSESNGYDRMIDKLPWITLISDKNVSNSLTMLSRIPKKEIKCILIEAIISINCCSIELLWTVALTSALISDANDKLSSDMRATAITLSRWYAVNTSGWAFLFAAAFTFDADSISARSVWIKIARATYGTFTIAWNVWIF